MPFFSANADGLFSAQDNTLLAPFVNYQGQNYRAEFALLSANQLQLISATPRADTPVYGASTLVDEQLNFSLQRVSYNGQLYNADVLHTQGDMFNITNIAVVVDDIPGRGSINHSTLINEVSLSQFNLLVSLYNLSNGTNVEISAQNNVQVYSVNYQTVDPSGALTQASALIAIPDDTEQSYPLIAYQHGTEVLRANAPSQDAFDLPTIALAASGYVVVSADYLGLGESESLHPYVHAHSLATVVIDAIRSARLFAQEKNVRLNAQLFLTGYSEGGYATMAVHRELQVNYSTEFSVTASAPMAGPYDLSGTMRAPIMDEQPLVNPFYFPYTLLAYNQVYAFTDQLSDYFQSPYDQTISRLYDGLHSSSEINSAIPEKQQLYTAALFNDLQTEENSWLQVALAENDTYRWVPEAPMFLFHCVQDNIVPFANTQIAYDYFQSAGASQVELFAIDNPLLNLGDVHTNCAIPLLLNGKAIFDGMVQ
ncbi:lipase family protein [Methyloprofundus sp.]|uniref:lipase family protein n=1 Tax=Methyloprofundus sp. TaxID=2020875 RepID=UPI003D0A2CB4